MYPRESLSTRCDRGGTFSAESACPHCGAGLEYTVIGLTWDHDEQAWRCLLCGHRTFPRPQQSAAQIEAERLWEQLADIADEEQRPDQHGQLDEWEEEVGEGAPAFSSSRALKLLPHSL